MLPYGEPTADIAVADRPHATFREAQGEPCDVHFADAARDCAPGGGEAPADYACDGAPPRSEPIYQEAPDHERRAIGVKEGAREKADPRWLAGEVEIGQKVGVRDQDRDVGFVELVDDDEDDQRWGYQPPARGGTFGDCSQLGIGGAH